MIVGTAFCLSIVLDGVKPRVLRRVEVPYDIRLDRLHLVIQAAMGWTNSHLFEFRGRNIGWSIPYPDHGPPDFLDARKARLDEVLEDLRTKSLKYLYDFGDGWEHTIKLERAVAADAEKLYPRLVEAKGRCPPEDVGGPWGYMEFVEAVNDPGHARHEYHAEWNGGPGFDPAEVDVDMLTRSVTTFARRWARRPTGRRSRRDTD